LCCFSDWLQWIGFRSAQEPRFRIQLIAVFWENGLFFLKLGVLLRGELRDRFDSTCFPAPRLLESIV
jgi:hypothetical protein